MKISTWKENSIALIVAIILALGVVLILKNSNSLKADILESNTNNKTKIQEGEILYQIKNNILSIDSNIDRNKIISMSLVLLFDVNKVKMTNTDINKYIQTEFEHTSASAGEGRINILLLNVNELKKGKNLFTLKLPNEESQVNISDVNIIFTDKSTENLSVTNK